MYNLAHVFHAYNLLMYNTAVYSDRYHYTSIKNRTF